MAVTEVGLLGTEGAMVSIDATRRAVQRGVRKGMTHDSDAGREIELLLTVLEGNLETLTLLHD